MIRNILVSVSASLDSLLAAKYAIYLAKITGAKLFAVYVIDKKVLGELLKSRIFVEVEARAYERDLEQEGKMFLERIQKMAESKAVTCETMLLRGAVSEEVSNKVSEKEVDIVVIGEIKELVSRSEIFYDEGEKIFRNSSCPVVIVKNQLKVDALYKEII